MKLEGGIRSLLHHSMYGLATLSHSKAQTASWGGCWVGGVRSDGTLGMLLVLLGVHSVHSRLSHPAGASQKALSSARRSLVRWQKLAALVRLAVHEVEKLAFAFLLFAEDDQNNQKKWYLEPVRGLTMLETMIRVLDAFFGVKCKKKSASDIRALAAGIASPGVRLRPFPYCISAPN